MFNEGIINGNVHEIGCISITVLGPFVRAFHLDLLIETKLTYFHYVTLFTCMFFKLSKLHKKNH